MISFLVLAVAAIGYFYQERATGQEHQATVALPVMESLPVMERIDQSLVCMVNDTYMGVPQILIQVEGKDYYGCCEGCKNRLKNEMKIRFALDPLTKELVDKADAFIVLTSGGNGRVLYFSSGENYKNFVTLRTQEP